MGPTSIQKASIYKGDNKQSEETQSKRREKSLLATSQTKD